MAFVHSKNTVLIVNGDDISVYCNASELERGSDEHDVTTYTKNDHVFAGGLGMGSQSIEGIYDNTAATGPRAVIEPLIGTVVPIVRRPEGTGAGKPQDAFSALVKKYVETSPVADMVKWAAELTVSDAVTSTTQA